MSHDYLLPETLSYPPPPLSSPSPLPSSQSGNATIIVAVVSSIGGFIALILIILLACFLRRRGQLLFIIFSVDNMINTFFLGFAALLRQSSFDAQVRGNFVQQMSLMAVKEATNNFSEDRTIGKGGFGVVYKGLSASGDVWAVKRAVGNKGNRRN